MKYLTILIAFQGCECNEPKLEMNPEGALEGEPGEGEGEPW